MYSGTVVEETAARLRRQAGDQQPQIFEDEVIEVPAARFQPLTDILIVREQLAERGRFGNFECAHAAPR